MLAEALTDVDVDVDGVGVGVDGVDVEDAAVEVDGVDVIEEDLFFPHCSKSSLLGTSSSSWSNPVVVFCSDFSLC